jgi:hypothetical protein
VIEARETSGRDADNRHRIAVDQDFLSEDSGILREATDPVVVAEYHNRMALVDLIVLLGAEHAPDGRLHPEQREVVARHHFGVEQFGLVVDADRHFRQPAAQYFAQGLGLPLELLIHRIRMHPLSHVAAVVRALLVEHDELIRSSDRKLAQDHLIDQREDGRVRANTQRQRQDRDDGEQGASEQASDSEADVVERKGHQRLRRGAECRGCHANALNERQIPELFSLPCSR